MAMTPADRWAAARIDGRSFAYAVFVALAGLAACWLGAQ
jgi:hypothetical protein